MKTEKSIQFLSNNRKLIAGPCKKQFFLSFYLFYYIHTPVPPLSQANQSDGNSVAREVEFDHHLTTSSPQPVPLIVFYVPTFFYNHHKQRRKLCTLHNFRRCIMAFACPSQFSDNCDRAGFRLVFVRYSVICAYKNAVVNGSQTAN